MKGEAHMFGSGFKYVETTGSFSISSLSCPGDCTGEVCFFWAGTTDVAQKSLKQLLNDGNSHDPGTDARKLVELEIQASPDTVGPPVVVLQVNENGPSLKSSDSGCPILVSSD